MNSTGVGKRIKVARWLLGAVGLLLLIGSLAACQLPVFGGDDEGPNPGPPTGGAPDIPELTVDERALAMQLVNDPDAVPEGAVSVPELAEVGRVSYEIESVGVWSTMKDLRKLGAVAEVVFSEPIVINATLPVTIYDDKERSFPPYTTDIKHAVFVEVGDLHVLIDLEHEQVVRIVPGSGKYVGPGTDQQSNITTMMSSPPMRRPEARDQLTPTVVPTLPSGYPETPPPDLPPKKATAFASHPTPAPTTKATLVAGINNWDRQGAGPAQLFLVRNSWRGPVAGPSDPWLQVYAGATKRQPEGTTVSGALRIYTISPETFHSESVGTFTTPIRRRIR